MSVWESNSASKDGSGNFNPPAPDAWVGSNNASAKTATVAEEACQGSVSGEWNPPASGAATKGTASGYAFVTDVINASLPWESNSASRK